MIQPELLKKRRPRPDVPPKLAGSAVNLCMGCPLANICPTKTPGECPPQLAEQIGDYGGGDYAPVIKASYLKELLDDSQPTVMANLVKKPTQKPKPIPKPVPKPAPAPPKSNPPKPPAHIRSAKKPQPAQHPPKHPHEYIGEAIADIFYGLFAVQSLGASACKK